MKIGKGANPFIDPVGYKAFLDENQKEFEAELQKQSQNATDERR